MMRVIWTVRKVLHRPLPLRLHTMLTKTMWDNRGASPAPTTRMPTLTARWRAATTLWVWTTATSWSITQPARGLLSQASRRSYDEGSTTCQPTVTTLSPHAFIWSLQYLVCNHKYGSAGAARKWIVMCVLQEYSGWIILKA